MSPDTDPPRTVGEPAATAAWMEWTCTDCGAEFDRFSGPRERPSESRS
jgi:hypothetical protein